jgi:hypothetical protein
VKVITALVVVILLMVAVTSLVTTGASLLRAAIVGTLLLLLLGGFYLWSVRGYRLEPDALLVLRPIGPYRLSLDGLQDAVCDPNVMSYSIRIFGNGGLFGFTGWYWNRKLKTHRMWVTDPKNAVLLTFGDKRIVVSPDDPAAFVAAVKTSW